MNVPKSIYLNKNISEYYNKNVIYIAYVGRENGYDVYKIGISDRMFERDYNEHRQTFGDEFQLILLEECDNNKKIEDMILKDLKIRNIWLSTYISKSGKSQKECFIATNEYTIEFIMLQCKDLIIKYPLQAVKDRDNKIKELEINNQYKMSENYKIELETQKEKEKTLQEIEKTKQLEIQKEQEKEKTLQEIEKTKQKQHELEIIQLNINTNPNYNSNTNIDINTINNTNTNSTSYGATPNTYTNIDVNTINNINNIDNNNIIDVRNNIYKYDGYLLNIFKDTHNNFWFYATNIINILGYKSIPFHLKLVNNNDKNFLSNINNTLTLTHNEKNRVYININGIKTLIKHHNLLKFNVFEDWICKKLIPTINNYNHELPPINHYNYNNDMIIEKKWKEYTITIIKKKIINFL